MGRLSITLHFFYPGWAVCIEPPQKSLADPSAAPGAVASLSARLMAPSRASVGAVAFGCSSLTAGKWPCAEILELPAHPPANISYISGAGGEDYTNNCKKKILLFIFVVVP